MAILGCLPEKEVDIKLPDYERQLVVECLMEPGKPFRMLLSESVGFNDGLDTPFVEGALVVITYNGFRDTLSERFSFDPNGLKIFNYSSNNVVPFDYTTEYELYVKSVDGREVTGKAKVMRPVTKPNLSLDYNDAGKASLTINWPDFAGESNYYRCYLHRCNAEDPCGPGSSGALQFDFTLDDRIGDGEMFTIATLFEFDSTDVLTASVAQIDYPYWRYINSKDDAQSSNGNPFAQPGAIQSTVQGGIGVFAGFQLAFDSIVVQ